MNTKQNKDALGKGIRSLLQSIDADLKTPSGELKPKVAESVTGSLRIALDQIDTNPKQPRNDFDEQSMQELAASIKTFDIIQPVTVSKLPPINGNRIPWNNVRARGIKIMTCGISSIV